MDILGGDASQAGQQQGGQQGGDDQQGGDQQQGDQQQQGGHQHHHQHHPHHHHHHMHVQQPQTVVVPDAHVPVGQPVPVSVNVVPVHPSQGVMDDDKHSDVKLVGDMGHDGVVVGQQVDESGRKRRRRVQHVSAGDQAASFRLSSDNEHRHLPRQRERPSARSQPPYCALCSVGRKSTASKGSRSWTYCDTCGPEYPLCVRSRRWHIKDGATDPDDRMDNGETCWVLWHTVADLTSLERVQAAPRKRSRIEQQVGQAQQQGNLAPEGLLVPGAVVHGSVVDKSQ